MGEGGARHVARIGWDGRGFRLLGDSGLPMDSRLEVLDDLLYLVAVGGVAFQVTLVVADGPVEVALLRIGSCDVVEDVRVGKDLVSEFELDDALVVLAVGDELHSLLEVGTRVGSGISEGRGAQGVRAAHAPEDGPHGPAKAGAS